MTEFTGDLPPLGLYIHIPWCIKKCPYCDFNSHRLDNELPEAAYVAALLTDLDQHTRFVGDRTLTSIFIGGGTPSLFSAAAIEQLLQGVAERVALADDIEITLEANPGSAEQARFAGYRQAGVNRLSIGIQSFSDTYLQRLGRVHNGANARAAAEAARAAGIDNINLDLMHGLPEQTLAHALADLSAAIALAPEHLSWYQLTVEPNTVFYTQRPRLPAEELCWEIQEQGQALLADAGYRQYEVSAYCREQATSRHNTNYWQFGDYIGIGAGAHGKLSTREGVLRTQQTRLPTDYLRDPAGARRDTVVKPDQLALEFMLNALRLNQGVPSSTFSCRTGLGLESIQAALAAGRDAGLLVSDPQHLRCTPLGLRFLNDTLALFDAT